MANLDRQAQAADRPAAGQDAQVGIESWALAGPSPTVSPPRSTFPEQLGDTVRHAPGATTSAELSRAAFASQAGRIVQAAIALSAGVRLCAARVSPTALRGAAAARAAIADGRATATLDAMIG